MQRRFTKFILACLSLLMMGQSVLPVAALAQVSVRCKSVSSVPATPCVQTTLLASDTAGIAKQMACCQSMAGTSARSAAVAAPDCLVAVTVLDTKPVSLGLPRHPWLLHSAPALAPPVSQTGFAAPAIFPTIHFSSASFDLLPRAAVHSHGLRGPPHV